MRGLDRLELSFACDQRSAAGAAQGIGHQGRQHDTDGHPHGIVAAGTEVLVAHAIHLKFACDRGSAASAAQGVGDQGGQHDPNGHPQGMIAAGTEVLVTHDLHLG